MAVALTLLIASCGGGNEKSNVERYCSLHGMVCQDSRAGHLGDNIAITMHGYDPDHDVILFSDYEPINNTTVKADKEGVIELHVQIVATMIPGDYTFVAVQRLSDGAPNVLYAKIFAAGDSDPDPERLDQDASFEVLDRVNDYLASHR